MIDNNMYANPVSEFEAQIIQNANGWFIVRISEPTQHGYIWERVKRYKTLYFAKRFVRKYLKEAKEARRISDNELKLTLIESYI